MTITFSELQSLAVGLVALVAAGAIVRALPWLARASVPVPVIGGILVALGAAVLFRFGDVTLQFSTGLRDFFLLVFFTSVGLSAKLSLLKAGGRPLVILCLATVILLVAQNLTGLAMAWVTGAHPFYGLLVGSISFVGGPGTAAAWAQEGQAMGLANAPEIAIGAATLAVVVGALVSGPVTGWLVRRRNLSGPSGDSPASWAAPEKAESAPAPPIATVMAVLLLIVLAVLIGGLVNDWARANGWVLPGFLTAMLAGALIINVADVFGARIDFSPIERGGEISLQLFLVMFLMSLKLWTLGAAIGPLMANVALQVLVTVLIAVFVLFRWLGRDYDAAVTVGGFLGFGLSSMPVAMATMDSVALRYGPSPKAFLLIALAGSFFVDLANAVIVKLFMMMPGVG